MNVLVYAHAFAPSIGGAETYVMLLARGLAERLSVQAADGAGAGSVTVATATPADGFDDAALPFAVARRPSLPSLWRLIGRADVVHLAGPVFLPLLLALLRRKPVVVEHHGYQAICPNGLLFYEPARAPCPGHFMARRYWQCLRCTAQARGRAASVRLLALTFARRWLCSRASCHVGVSQHVTRRLGLPRATTIYHGVPPASAAGPATNLVPPPPSAGEAPPSFAYVGRLVAEKGLPLLLQAAALLRCQGCELRLRLIGDGPERSRLERLAEQLGVGDAVAFTGFLQGAALEAALADARAVIMPSIWEETAGLAAIEHMRRGRLVIAAAIGGLGEVVGEAGLKFEVGDVRGLAECMRRALLDPSLAREFGQKARERALNLFSQDRMVAAHLEAYQRLGRGLRP